jgi:hypothetical protein
MTPDEDARLHTVRRQLRLLAILLGARQAGVAPLPAKQLHTVAYFADALSPVWGLQILDSQLLKTRAGPFSPALQEDLDLLVGQGVVTASNVTHTRDDDGAWRLSAEYHLNSQFADRIIARALEFARFGSEFVYVREVVYATSRFDASSIGDAASSDAAYGNELIDFGGLVDIETFREQVNQTSRVAKRFGELMRSEAEVTLAPSELIHLYVRALQERVADAA